MHTCLPWTSVAPGMPALVFGGSGYVLGSGRGGATSSIDTHKPFVRPNSEQ